MKFKQELSKTLSTRITREGRRKFHIADGTQINQSIRHSSTLKYHCEETMCHSGLCKGKLQDCDQTDICHQRLVFIHEDKNLGRHSKSFLKMNEDENQKEHANFEKCVSQSNKLEKKQICKNICEFVHYKSEKEYLRKLKRNNCKETFLKSKKQKHFLKRMTSLNRHSSRPTEKKISENLKSYILTNISDIADVEKRRATHKKLKSKIEDCQSTKQNGQIDKESYLKAPNLDIKLGQNNSVIALPSKSLPSVTLKDLTPTCADIYGVDEVDNVAFEKNVVNKDIESKVSLPYFCGSEEENGATFKATNGNSKKKHFKQAVFNVSPQLMNTYLKNSDSKEKNNCNDTPLDQSATVHTVSETPCFRNITNSEVLNKDFSKLSDSNLGEEYTYHPLAENDTGKELYDNPWVLQDKLNKSVHKSLNLRNIEIESSLGFETKHSSDTELDCSKPLQLIRSDSFDSIDSFGSSYHSLNSVKDLFFSDSEAEHNLHEISHVSQKNTPEPSDKSKKNMKNVPKELIVNQVGDCTKINEFHKEAKLNEKTAQSDSDSDQTQMFPYALSENFGDNLTTRRKKKKMHSKSDEKLDKCLTGTPGEKRHKLQSVPVSYEFDWDNESKGAKSKEVSKRCRRSLDSSLAQRNILNEFNSPENRLSAMHCSSEFLSPVLESEVKVSKIDNMNPEHSGKGLDSTRFFTLPNPKRLKAQQSNLRKRLGSVSKLINDKAQSLSNLKMGASFKLRKEIEKSKSLVSSSASSFSDLMTKKASSFSTLIRRRTNSNTALESPFKNYTKKTCKVEDENKTELVYEKVIVKVPIKRSITDLESKARSKRLKVNLRLAKNAAKSESESHDYESRSVKDGSLGQLWRSGSFTPVRSPTLLDEIMKCVDTAMVRQQCSLTNDDYEPSDSEESSSGSSLFLFQKQYSLESETKDTMYMSICRGCGKIQNSTKLSSGSSDTLAFKRQSSACKFSLSLCDLNSTCQCLKNSQLARHRFSLVLPSQEFVITNSLTGNKHRSWDVIADMKSECPGGTKDGRPIQRGLFSVSSQRPSSMFDLRDDLDKTQQKVEFEIGNNENKDNENTYVLPGALLRHRPVLDLSGEHLDETIDSEDGVNDYEKDPYARRSQSCGDLIDPRKSLDSDFNVKGFAKNVEVKIETEDDSESYHSCSETVENVADINDVEREISNEKVRSNSCSDLLEAKGIGLGEELKQMEKRKKELRKVKVKSMSSSHDALSVLVPIDMNNIDESVNSALSSKEKTDYENRNKTVGNGQSVVNDILEFVQNGKETSQSVSTDNGDTAILTVDNDQLDIVQFRNDGEEKVNFVCDKCNNERQYGTKDVKKNYEMDSNTKIISKPPLPHSRDKAKVLSLSDISNNDLKDNKDFRRQKGFSLTELGKTNISVNYCKCGLEKTSVSVPTVVVPSLISTPKSASVKVPVSKFLFDDQQVRRYIKTVSKLDRQTSISSDNVKKDSPRILGSEKLYSACSLNGLSKDSWSDEVFNRLSCPIGAQLSPYLQFFESTPVEHRPRFSSSSIQTAGLPDLPELPSLTEECVSNYDICLGYLLYSVQCDNRMICVYSLQRNKQLMESVITPLTVSPHTPRRKSQEHGGLNKNKAQCKTKPDDLPNPAAPITSVPSDRLAHAGHVLRTVLLARASHMIRDRKFHLRTYRKCMVGTEMVDWLLQQSALVHSRTQAVGMWQALVEEGVVVHVCHEHQFKDKYLFYRFLDDDEGVSTVPSSATKRECEENLQDVLLMLAHIGPDAMMRMILRKPPHERTAEDLEIIYEELLHIKALSHLSTMVKRELASVLLFESHDKSGTVLFNQGDEGKSWYIILKGSVNVVIYGKGVVCTLHEGDDFGKLALVNDAPRAATIVLRDDNCHFLRVDKEDFNRILRDVEANTVRLKEHGLDVLVLEKIPSNTQSADGSVQAHYKYSVMAGTPEKMLEHLLDSRIDNKNETEIDGFLEDFLLTHVIFMPCNHLCPVLLSHYHSSSADSTEQEGFEFMLNHKKCVLHFVQEWSNIVGVAFKEDQTINAFLEELHSCVNDDIQYYPALKNDLSALKGILSAHSGSPSSKLKKRASGTFTLSRKHSKDCFQDLPKKRKPVNPSDEAIFKVYCADHTYSTLKLPMDTKVETLLMSTKEKLGLGDDLILCEVKSTGERLIFKENDLCVTTGLSINGRLFVTPKEHLDALTPLPEQEGICNGTFSTIEMFSSREMAYHMTLYDWELFTCVQEYELIYQVFGRYKFGKITANLDLFLRRFNEIQFWVVTEMVLTSNLSKRVSLLRKFIKLAAHCKEFKDLNGFFAIVMGLSNIAVSRLSQTWEKLPSKFKKMFEDFETLMDPSRNHRVYRLSVSKMLPPVLPFMPLLMKDMTFTHEGNKTYFDGLVNFEKMHMIAQTLKTVRFCRSARLELDAPGTLKSSDTAEYIRNLKVIDNQRSLTQLSHKLEPRKT